MKERTAREVAQAAERYVGHGRAGAAARGASTAAERCRDAHS